MGVAEKFRTFCENLRMDSGVVDVVSIRYHRIVRQLNDDFYGIDNELQHGLYVGSYGRGTAINTSDIDILFVLPYDVYAQYDSYLYNGQSSLLQAVRNSLQKTYPASRIKGDGQVIVVDFSDGITFEIVPCFVNKAGSYTYPDSNDGGRWRVTNPKPEIEEVNIINNETNKNLKKLCRMVRAWKEYNNIPMGGLLIDTFACRFLKAWKYNNESFLYYYWMTRDFLGWLSQIDDTKDYWLAIGSDQRIDNRGRFAYKAKIAFNIACQAIDYEKRQMEYSANQKWREIYGTKFPY